MAQSFAGEQWQSVNKLFILDCCYAGGFWDSVSKTAISSLPRAALLAAAPAGVKADAVGVPTGPPWQGATGFALANVLQGLTSAPSIPYTDLINGIHTQFQTPELHGNGRILDAPIDPEWLVEVPITDNIGWYAAADFTFPFGVFDAPFAVSDTAEATANVPANIAVLTNDEDAQSIIDATTVVIITPPSHGSATINPITGAVTYVAAANFSGPDTFTYRVKNVAGAESNIATVDITVDAGGNIAPTANDDSATTRRNTPVIIDVLSNDSDPDGAVDPSSVVVFASPGHGTTSVDPTTGAITYTPTSGYTGPDSFTYRVLDDSGASSNSATVNIVVSSALMSIRAIATDLSGTPISSITVGSQFEIQLIVQDVRDPVAPFPGVFSAFANLSYDPALSTVDPAQSLTFGSFFSVAHTFDLSSPGSILGAGAASGSLTPPITGNAPQFLWSVVATATGIGGQTLTLSFDHGAGHDLTLYGLNDKLSEQDVEFIDGLIDVLNAPPVALDDLATTQINQPVTINVVSNDSDVFGSIDATTVAIVGSPSHGTTSVDPITGAITYTPASNYIGSDSFIYKVKDNLGADSNVATVSILVAAPQIAINKVTVDGATSGDGLNILAGDPITWRYTVTNTGNVGLANVSVSDNQGVTPVYQTGDANGNGLLDLSETWIYTAPGTAAAGSYSNIGTANGRFTDSAGHVAITSASDPSSYFGNTPPVANNDTATTNKNTAVVVSVLSNDNDSDGTLNSATVAVVGAASHGTTSVDPTTGAITYTPASNYTGPDSFTYKVKDNAGADSNVATVSVTVNGSSTFSTKVLTDLSHPKEGGSTLPVQMQVLDGAGNNVSSSSLKVNVLGIGTSDSQPVGTLVPASDAGQSSPGGQFRLIGNAYMFNLKLVDGSGKALHKGTYYLYFTIAGDPTVRTLAFFVK